MSKLDIRDILYSKEKSPLEFNFDALMAPSLLQFMSVGDIDRLYNIASSVRYANNLRYKKTEIKKIMEARDFKHFASGTNRTVYRPLEYPPLVTKIALGEQGLQDNPAEFLNQSFLKPFVTKVFESVPSGVIAGFERVNPITSILEFQSIAPDYFDMLVNKIIGRYVVADVGTNYFMNVGVRPGLGPVLLDYSFIYEIDGGKLFCRIPSRPGSAEACGGVIDYDDGFNNLICQKCGRIYNAKDLRKEDHGGIKIIREGDDIPMNIQICKGNEVVEEIRSETDSINFNPKVKETKPKLFRGETLEERVGDEEMKISIISRKVPMTQKEVSKARTDAARESARENRIAEFRAKQLGLVTEEEAEGLNRIPSDDLQQPPKQAKELVIKFSMTEDEPVAVSENKKMNVIVPEEPITTLEKPYYMSNTPSALDDDDEETEPVETKEDTSDLYKDFNADKIEHVESIEDLGDLEGLGISEDDFKEPELSNEMEEQSSRESVHKRNSGKY